LNHLSEGVISGFISAVAIIIVLTQIKYLLGLDFNHSYGYGLLIVLFFKLSEINIPTLIIGTWSMTVLNCFKKIIPRFPISIFVVLLSTLFVYYFKLYNFGVNILGDVPKGFPRFEIPSLSIESFKVLFSTALTISFVGYMESITVARAFAVKGRYTLDSNQELKSLGLANIIGSFYSSLPVTGAISRTAVNYESGAKTTLSSIITACLIIIILLFFTHIFFLSSEDSISCYYYCSSI
jgi:SulP family sulfate permease